MYKFNKKHIFIVVTFTDVCPLLQSNLDGIGAVSKDTPSFSVCSF